MTAAVADATTSLDRAPRLRCLDCASAFAPEGHCPRCGRSYPEADGITEAIGPLRGTNRVAARFYDGPSWTRFEPWERVFLWFHGGDVGGRIQALRHLGPRARAARVLDVGIGAGACLEALPRDWSVAGVDIARNRLVACRERFPRLRGRLYLAEAEALPFADAAFDAVYSLGGFNFFRDRAQALREMRRVVRPGGAVVVADEIPTLGRFALGHFLGLDALDEWALRGMGLDREFALMALRGGFDVRAFAARHAPAARLVPIWGRLGYCLVESSSANLRPETLACP